MINNKRIWKTGALAVAMTVVFAIFAFIAADWTKGLSSEFIVYGQASTGSSGGSGGGTNWGKFPAGGAISVTSFFELRHSQSRALFARVGVAASRADLGSFVIARVREKQLASSGLADVDTGFALVNTGSAPTLVTVTVK